MSAAEVEFVVRHVDVAYYPPQEIILSPAAGVPTHCCIVKQGSVRGEIGDSGALAFEADVGDCFPVGALLADRPVALTYRAVGDTFCLLLPREMFAQLVQTSPAFRDFCTRRLGSMLDLARRQIQQGYATETSVERTMATPLGELARRPPVMCAPSTPLREAFEQMRAAHVGSIVVVDPAREGSVVGILTRTDLIGRVVLPEIPLTAPVSAVMSPNVRTLDAGAPAVDATLMMAEHSIRHIPIVQNVDGRQQVIGVVAERDLFTLQRLGVRHLSAEIGRAGDVEALITLAADVRRLSHHLVAQGVQAAELTRLITQLNDRLTVRLLELTAQTFGIATDSFCWLSFGSEGRQEQTIATDQDNGILYVEGAVPRERLLEFAERVNSDLARCGFPLCKGNIMARNPQWCLAYQQWADLFTRWIDRGDPDALLNASIFFDLRPLFGNMALASRLRADVMVRARSNQRFLKQMADNALRNRPPGVGLVDALLGKSTHVDLKMNGTVPFVDAARIWAYAGGVVETNTTERLARLAELHRLPEADVQGWIAAFEFFQLLRLREQHRRQDDASPDTNPNRAELARLSALDRRVIAEAFRQARKLQQRLELDFPG